MGKGEKRVLVILLSIIFRFFVTWCVFLEQSKNIQKNHHIIIFLYNKNCHREGMEIKKIKRTLCRRRLLDNFLKKRNTNVRK